MMSLAAVWCICWQYKIVFECDTVPCVFMTKLLETRQTRWGVLVKKDLMGLVM